MNPFFRPRSVPSEQQAGVAAALSSGLLVSERLAEFFVSRGIVDPAAARALFSNRFEDLPSPLLLRDMDRAVARVVRALETGERVLVFGDYDVDGATGAAILYMGLRPVFGERISARLPHRERDGYGLSVAAVREAKKAGVSLVVTVDCGVSSGAAIEEGKTLGVDVIVTDHHEPPDPLPTPCALIDPKRHDDPYAFDMLAGVGLAWKLLHALELAGVPVRSRDRLDLVALGTIADMAPLVAENRVLATLGLESLARTDLPGLHALFAVAGIGMPSNRAALTATEVAFRLAPRINAIGRVADAKIALELLTATDPDRANLAAGMVEKANVRRKEIEAAMLAEAIRQAEAKRTLPVLVLFHPSWHHGVVGIVAQKIRERFSRPAILFAPLEGKADLRGSARSIAEYPIVDAFRDLAAHFTSYGGHAVAAGCSLPATGLEAFETAIVAHAANKLRECSFEPVTLYDVEASLPDLTQDLARELDRLAPFGMGNPTPAFLVRGVRVLESRTMGRTGDHLRIKAAAPRGPVNLVGFSKAAAFKAFGAPPGPLDLVVSFEEAKPEGSPYGGERSLVIAGMRPADGKGVMHHAPTDRPASVTGSREPDAYEEIRASGNLHLAAKRFREAADDYARAIALEPNRPEAHYNLGLCLWRLDDPGGAALAFRSALERVLPAHERLAREARRKLAEIDLRPRSNPAP